MNVDDPSLKSDKIVTAAQAADTTPVDKSCKNNSEKTQPGNEVLLVDTSNISKAVNVDDKNDSETKTMESLKRRHSETSNDLEAEAKKTKTLENFLTDEDDDDLLAKLDAIDAPESSGETNAEKADDLLRKLEEVTEDGEKDELLEKLECIVEGKSPPIPKENLSLSENKIAAKVVQEKDDLIKRIEEVAESNDAQIEEIDTEKDDLLKRLEEAEKSSKNSENGNDSVQPDDAEILPGDKLQISQEEDQLEGNDQLADTEPMDIDSDEVVDEFVPKDGSKSIEIESETVKNDLPKELNVVKIISKPLEKSEIVEIDSQSGEKKSQPTENLKKSDAESIDKDENIVEAKTDKKNDVLIIDTKLQKLDKVTDSFKKQEDVIISLPTTTPSISTTKIERELDKIIPEEVQPKTGCEKLEQISEGKSKIADDENVSSDSMSTYNSGTTPIEKESTSEYEGSTTTIVTAQVHSPKAIDSLNESAETVDSSMKARISRGINLLMNNGSSTPNSKNTSSSSAAAAELFNTTPIQKMYEITTEHVTETSKKLVEEKMSIDDDIVSGSCDEGITTSASTVKGTTSGSGNETDPTISDGLNRFVKVIEKYNGMTTTTDDDISSSEDCKMHVIQHSETDTDSSQHCHQPKKEQQPQEKSNKSQQHDSSNLTNSASLANGSNLESFTDSTTNEHIYEINSCYEDNDLKFLYIEKFDKIRSRYTLADCAGTDSTGKISSNGSVSSLGPFQLQLTKTTSGLSSSSNTSSTLSSQPGFDGKFAIPALPQRNGVLITGLSSLCNHMIEYFAKIKQTLKEDDNTEEHLDTSSSTLDKTLSSEVVKTAGRKSDTKRPLNKSLEKEHKEETTSDEKSKGKQSTSKKAATINVEEFNNTDKIGNSVLARWVDKKYYAGRIIEEKSSNKFVVRFEDGPIKTLPSDSIVFGYENILPLQDQSVHALVAQDTYEPGFVTEINIDDNNITYTVVTDSQTVTVTASDIYLEDEQAKSIQAEIKDQQKLATDLSGQPKRHSRTATKDVDMSTSSSSMNALTPTSSSASSSRNKRGRKSEPIKIVQPVEAGFSGDVVGNKKGGRRGKRWEPQTAINTFPPESQSSDISDTIESDSAPNSPESALEAIDGVQPELQKTPRETQLNKICLLDEFLGSDKNMENMDDILGPIPTLKTLFRNKHFILTCTIPMRPQNIIEKKDDVNNKFKRFTTLPFVKEHLLKQIEAGGGKAYDHWENIPKNKYKQCKLIAPHPCATAKYVQCLAADIPALSHEWIIECCRRKSLVEKKNFLLPSGWSIIEDKYIKWSVGRGVDQRKSATPFNNIYVLLASENKDFTNFWSRVCKLAGAKMRIVKTVYDISESQNDSYMLTDNEFPQIIKAKASDFEIPVVSTVWVVQSLILGKICQPNQHESLTKIYDDDDC